MKVLTTPRSYGKTDPEVFAMLRAAGLEVVRNETGGILDREGMKALLADCDGVIVGVDPIDAEVIAAAPKLKAIAKYGVGVDNIDLDAAKARDIKVSRTVGANAEAVADYAMALLLAVARKTVLIDQHCRQGDWKKITTRDVTGGTIGILILTMTASGLAQCGPAGPGLRHEGAGPRPLLGRGVRQGPRHHPRRPRRDFRRVRRHLPPPAPDAGDGELHRRGGAGQNEAGRHPDQHRPGRPH